MQATLRIPAFTKGKDQIPPIEVEETRVIANVRINVDHIIGMALHNSPSYLEQYQLISLRSKAGEDIHLIDPLFVFVMLSVMYVIQ